jgi:hypothetical protein
VFLKVAVVATGLLLHRMKIPIDEFRAVQTGEAVLVPFFVESLYAWLGSKTFARNIFFIK